MNSPQELKFAVEADGAVVTIYDDCHADLFDESSVTVTRASHVEPSEGGWSADMTPVGGSILGPYRLRQEALDAEVEYLKHILF